MVRGMALTARMVTVDCANPDGLAQFWSEAAGYEVKWQQGGEFVILGPVGNGQNHGDAIRLGLQRVPEPRSGKNRVHIDWAADDRPAEVDRLVRLGATVLDERTVPGLSWTVLADPEGNEFCVSGAHG